MSGVIDINSSPTPQVKHTHAIFRFRCTDGQERFLHFVDPRRFGKIGFIHPGAEARESEFKDLGVEPLDETVALGDYLWKQSRNKSAPIKNFIMDQRVVVGVGNIYASESLFRARISPLKSANKVTRACYEQLAASIRETLSDAIEQGGTSFRDFRHVDGTKGYFEVKLNVYGRVGQSCSACNGMIRQIRQSGRSTFYCPRCQR
jgi:formamidopyrimidine-DNA glycosylase